MLVTVSDLVKYVRGIDERLQNETEYPDSHIRNQIGYGIQNLAAQLQCFVKEEFIELAPYVATGLKFNIVPTEEVLGYFDIQLMEMTPMGVGKSHCFECVRENQNRSITVDFPIKPITDMYLKLRYFFAPDITDKEELVLESEVFHFLKHAIQSVVWGGLKDYQKEQYHQKTLNLHASEKILQHPVDFIPETMKGGFV